ncbi:NERD domain-containing protein [Lysinibacillus yapensis]|uniref:NERD domain-containing protein n=1 Tax=Ureibacillus yapensis TaxID=2304605 RepID=A0A396SFF0_9BACL|nr:nuclease-related domain-containing protein [Lysinibacillus yapensis]RHW40064.1 NERD domain-containing protein [Lysinibacillus yapensis]
MEILKRRKSGKLLSLEALMRRLPESDREYDYYKEMYFSQKKGYEGERYTNQLWKEIEMPSPHFLFHSLEPINQAGNSHQIDTLLLTPHFIWLLEIKNIGGRIDIDESKHQMIRTKQEGTIESFRNPVNQIKRHAHFVNGLMREIGISIPIEYAIVIVSDSTIIGSVPREVSIFHASGLHAEVSRLLGKYKEKQITALQLNYVMKDLMKRHSPKSWKPKIDFSKLRRGVLCEKCEYKSVMVFEHGRFICPKCSFKSNEAHLQALLDYRYLCNEWITNRELRDYLNIDSRMQ